VVSSCSREANEHNKTENRASKQASKQAASKQQEAKQEHMDLTSPKAVPKFL